MKTEDFRIADITNDSIVDGPGLRLTVFFQGCPHDCPGCHNPQTHDPNGGNVCTLSDIEAAIDKNPLLSGVTLSGGEPFLQAGAAAQVARLAHEKGLDVITYTGFTAQELESKRASEPEAQALFLQSDYIIEGRFIQSQRTLEKRFRGSKNQRIIDVAATKKANETIFCEL